MEKLTDNDLYFINFLFYINIRFKLINNDGN